MTPEEYKKVTETFLRLCELSAEERKDSLGLLKQQDADLHKAVEAMLRLDSDDDVRFRSAADASVSSDSPDGHVMLSTMHRGDNPSVVRYQLTRLHATGGMGRVWLARDNSIGRNVALKELRPETTAAPGVWNRFLNEARVTGQLEHPGIVPVYEVDSDDADRPFYTMRFVRGQTLKDAVNKFTERRLVGQASQMDLRELVTALIGVANAVGYAHSRGVLHRDLKGQNVVLGDYGEVIVLDWGLACIVGTPDVLEDDQLPVSGSGISDQTRAGQIIGTPAYMSPEQAFGRREQMNVQTDVFGLGVILYEILTGQSPYGGEVAAETLALAQAGNVASPRTIWVGVPPALEAICLKAMARKQNDRYSSAIEFADELRRWQADESVLAYADPWATRFNRWARRHQTLVATLAMLTFATIVGLTVSTLLISNEQRKTAFARSRAEANLAKAREAVQQMLTEVGDERLKNVPQMEKLREKLLQEALEFNTGFLLESNDPIVRREAGLAYGNLASIYQMLGKSDEAVGALLKGIEILNELHASAPNNLQYTTTLASNLLNLAHLQERLKNYAEAEATCQDSLALLEPLAGESAVADSILGTIAGCQRTIGNCKGAAGDSVDAESWYRTAISSYERMSEDGRGSLPVLQDHSNLRGFLGQLFVKTGRTTEAREQFDVMLDFTSQLVEQKPESHEYRELLSQAYQNLSEIERGIGDRVVSREYAIESLRVRDELARDFPHIADYQYAVASGCGSIAISFAESGDSKQAETYFVRGAEAARKLSASFPSIPTYRYQAAVSIRVAGVFLFNNRKIEEAKIELLDAISRLESLIADFPEVPVYRLDLAIALHPLARCYQFTNTPAEARKVTERSISIYEGLIKEKTDIVKVRHKLAQDYRLMGELLVTEKDTASAELFLRKSITLHRQMAAEFPDVAEHHRLAAIGLDKLAEFQLPNEQLDEALAAVEESIEIRQGLVAKNPTWFQPQVELPNCLLLKGRILEAMKDFAGAAAMFESSAAMCADLLIRFPEDSNLREDYANSWEQRARLYKTAGQFAEATSEFGKATAIRRESVAMFPEESRAKDQLRKNLGELANLHLSGDDPETALTLLMQAVVLPEPTRWEDCMGQARLLARCHNMQISSEETPAPLASGVSVPGDLAVNAIVLAIQLGLPDVKDALLAPEFQSLRTLDSWKERIESAHR